MSVKGLETRSLEQAGNDSLVIGSTGHEYGSIKLFVGEKERGG
jgi:hypothetical protein